MRSRGWWIGATGLAVAAFTLGGVPAHAVTPATAPQVGECYDLDAQVLRDGGWWTEAEAVPCTEPHTFEVAEVGLLPADVNAFEFAERECSALSTWTAFRVNLPVAGVVKNPLRIVPVSFAVREAPASFVCGGVAVRYLGEAEPVPVAVRSSFRQLSARERLALRHCADASDGRGALEAPVTVRCARRPSWLVASWITWKAFYDDYPGRTELRRRAGELCGPGETFSLPTRADWQGGVPSTWCYRLRA